MSKPAPYDDPLKTLVEDFVAKLADEVLTDKRHGRAEEFPLLPQRLPEMIADSVEAERSVQWALAEHLAYALEHDPWKPSTSEECLHRIVAEFELFRKLYIERKGVPIKR